MTKKILYIILVIVIIIILAIIWKKPKTEAPATTNNNAINTQQVETKATIGNELNNMNIDTGINQDLNSMDKDIKSL